VTANIRPSGSRLRIRDRCALWAAGLLTFFATALNNITLASNEYLGVVVAAIVWSIAALALIAATWRRMPAYGRVLAVPAILLNAWTLLDAGGRRLPAILGW
jgi:hypothetical protein